MTTPKRNSFSGFGSARIAELEEALVAIFRTALKTASFVGGRMVDRFESAIRPLLRPRALRRVGAEQTPCALL